MRITILGSLLAVAAATLFAVSNPQSVSHEAGVYEEIGRQLIANTTEGRQAVVSSVWWPPFCTLVRLPLVFAMPDDGFPWASVCISSLCGFFVLSFLWRCGINLAGRFRTMAICAMLAASPFFLLLAVSGSSAFLTALLAVVAADSMVRWLSLRSVRALVYFAVCSALICGLSPELAVWSGMMMALFLIDLLHSRSISRKQKEAVVIIGVLPAAYVLALWFLMNWLIMGDALYFIKPLWKVRLLPTVEGGGAARLGLIHMACGLIPAFTAGISAGMRNRTGMLWSMFTLFLFVTALLFRSAGMLWNDTQVLSMLPVFVFFTAVAVMGHVGAAAAAGWRRALVLLPAAVLVISYAEPEAGDRERPNGIDLPVVERHVLARSRYAKVFVCGYESFDVLRGKRSDVFTHALDFNFNKAKDDYRGHDLFVMVKKPAGRGSGDSIHWKYADIYSLGSDETLYDADWADWRIFQVIQAPEEEKQE